MLNLFIFNQNAGTMFSEPDTGFRHDCEQWATADFEEMMWNLKENKNIENEMSVH